MKRNYPDKFVVSKGSPQHEWDVTREGDEYRWITTLDNLDIGTYNAAYMDKLSDTYKFIFPEPELVFPFTYYHEDEPEDNGTVTLNQANPNFVDVKCSTQKDAMGFFSVENVKRYIKEGIWIVTSVGEQKLVEGSTSKSNDISTLTIKIDATEAMNALAEAAERVNIALESMQKIMNEMGLTRQAVESSWEDHFQFNFK